MSSFPRELNFPFEGYFLLIGWWTQIWSWNPSQTRRPPNSVGNMWASGGPQPLGKSGRLRGPLCMCAESLQWCLSLCDPVDHCLPGPSVHGILQARILEWVAVPSSRESSQPSDWTHDFSVSCIAGGFFTHWATWEAPNVPLDYPKRNSIWTSSCSSSGINHAPIHTLLSNLFSA